jgi:diamine N-acetyltransferase
MPPTVELREVAPDNWRRCALLEVGTDQRDFVMPVTYSLCLCHYGGLWNPLAACDGDEIIGFLMRAIDPADGSCWIGRFTVDHGRQRRGHGRAMIEALVRRQRELGTARRSRSATQRTTARRATSTGHSVSSRPASARATRRSHASRPAPAERGFAPSPAFSGIICARCACSSVGSERRSTEPKAAGSSPARRATPSSCTPSRDHPRAVPGRPPSAPAEAQQEVQ